MLTNSPRRSVDAAVRALLIGVIIGGCSSGGVSTGTGGSPGSGGTSATGGVGTGGGTGGGSGGAPGTGGGTTGQTGGSAGSTTAGKGGSGGSAAGTGGAAGSVAGGTGGSAGGTGGSAGSASGGQPGSGGSAGTGQAGSAGATGGSGGASNCPGQALSLSHNGYGTGKTGANNDAAAARVDVDFGTSQDLPVGNAKRTIEYWAYVHANDWVGNANTMFFYGSTARPAHGFGLDFGTDAVMGMAGNHATLDPYTNGGYDDDSTASIGLTSSKDQWAHFAMTWDGTAVRTFVNGVEVITKMGDSGVTMLNTDRSAITIGGYEADGNYFDGYIDEFRVWNVARTASEIASTMSKPLVGNEPGLVLYLKFDGTLGDSVTSSGHTAHAGTMSADKPADDPTFVISTAPLSCP